jgi:LysM repeat protein
VEDYDMEVYKRQPGMRIHFVQPGETLWELAKENRSTIEEIRKRNELTTEEIVPGQKLLLLKRIAAPVTF